uniref:Uncharacterized protein n=1 Tax=Nicotiana tabacum TaxID=4097 RepID=A0A1S3XD10_TOBAC|nr:PREDICTED: uncharacterized protein LOC107763830 [Nicotiana tabacum]
MGEMVENGLKTGRIISQTALKAAAQAVQIEYDNFSNTNERDEEIMVISGSRRGPRRTSRRYVQPHQVFHDPLKHYYPLPNPPYFVDPSQYVAQPLNHPRKRARVSQNLHPPPQNFQVPYNPHPSQGYRKKQKLKDSFTPIGESYASLFEKLKQHGMIAPIPPNQVDRRARSFDSSKWCEYHSNALRHNVENCRDLKREIERTIRENLIQDSGTQNITLHPLHEEAHLVGMMPGDIRYENPRGNLLIEVEDTDADSGHGNMDAKLSG